MPLPSDWEAVRVQLDRSIEAQLCNWITGDLKERWHNPDSSPTTSSWTSPNSDSGWNRPSTTVGSASSTTSRPLTVATKAREATLLTELLAECQQTAIQLCTEHGLSWENEDAASDGKMARGTSIAKQVRESSPPFLKWGGAKRNLLILPANLSEELDTRWKSIFTEPISILRLRRSNRHSSWPMENRSFSKRFSCDCIAIQRTSRISSHAWSLAATSIGYP